MSSSNDRDILPGFLKPSHYDLSLHQLELGGNFTYEGVVSIDFRLLEGTKNITLNSKELIIHSAEVKIGTNSESTRETIQCNDVSYDIPKQRAILTFENNVPVSDTLTLIIKFQGILNSDMSGFYRSKYKPETTPATSVHKIGEHHYMFSTQFESCDARRAFPCFDEPNLKATFDFDIEVPKDLVVLSNMPEKSTKESTREGFHIVSFIRTPIMSTYLLAWAVGDFEYIEDFTKGVYNGKPVPVRVYTTRGLKHQAQYALDHAPNIIDYFSELFGIDYPLPKADLLAVHEFTQGAMENWGLVTYRTTAVLYDEAASASRYKNRVAYVVAHELAHQWFGNLVTMDWWSELWLNEGFATWIGYLALDHFHPEWEIWAQFVSDSMEQAFALDSLRSSHPIEVPVKDALEVDQVFDAISYRKGSSIIRMLATHLGIETFFRGVTIYLKAHAYGNATTNDLWAAISKASNQDINSLMDAWIGKIGFPVLTITEEPGQISIRQSRYLSTGDVRSEDDATIWWIPLGVRTETNTKDNASATFSKKEGILRDLDHSFYKLNADNAGLYRTNYPPARLITLGTQSSHLTECDKIGLISDAGALAFSGDSTTPTLLALLEGFSSERDYFVWTEILGSFGKVKAAFSEDKAVSDGMRAYLLKLITPSIKEISWDASSEENDLTPQLRSLLLSNAGANNHLNVIEEAQRRFSLYLKGEKSAITKNLRAAIFRTVIRNGGAAEYHALKEEWRSTTSVDGKIIALEAMGKFKDVELFDDYIKFVLNEVPPQDMHTGAASLAGNKKMRYLLWSYIQEKFDEIKILLGGNPLVLNRFLLQSLQKFNDQETAKEIADFFKEKDNRGYDRTLGIVSDKILGRAAYRERDSKLVSEWLQAQEYL